MIEVLSVASEIHPLVKTGGLADVTGALPKALAAHDVAMRTLVPGYPAVIAATRGGRRLAEFDDLFGGRARLVASEAAGLDLIVLEAAHLFNRGGGPYQDEQHADWADNWRRFAALSMAAAEIARGRIKDYAPEIVHCHDWQTGLAPAYLAYTPAPGVKTVMTVHNLAFQGQFGSDIFGALGLPVQANSVGGVEYYGGIGFLKAGLQFADAITTVSPTYAREIRTPELGMGLDGVLNARRGVLTGILNGIDGEAWDPGEDRALARPYRAGSAHLRARNKRKLEERLGLQPSEGPLFCAVSRLTWQKGMDLLAGCTDGLVADGGRLAVLGSGDASIEAALYRQATRHRGRVAFVSGFDEELSHLMQGGADALLVPSRFEPCGLTQLIGLRYGCVPVVSRVGGLADTVIDANEAALSAGAATGIQFLPVTAFGLSEAIRRAIALYSEPKVWKGIQRRGMKSDVSWDASAERYAGLYRNLLGRTRDDDDQNG